MQLAIAKEVTESDLLKYPVSKGRKHIRITTDALDTLKALNSFKIDIARLLSLKIHKLSLGIELDYSDPTQFKRAYELIKNWGKNEESIHPQT